jgi:hypothetical protein
LREVPPSPGWPFADKNPAASVRGDLVYDAWSYLCDDVRGRHIWTAPPGDYD